MGRVQDAVDDGVAQIDVGGSHVDLRAQALLPVLVLARPHLLEQAEVLLGGPVSIRAFDARLGQRAAGIFDLLGGKVAHERLALLDEADGVRVDVVKEVGRVALARPFIAQPMDVGADGVDELRLFLGRVGVVKEEVALAAVFEGGAEVDEHALGVADVQIAVGFGREARLHLFGAQLPRRDVLVDDLFDEVGCLGQPDGSCHIFTPIFWKILPMRDTPAPIRTARRSRPFRRRRCARRRGARPGRA